MCRLSYSRITEPEAVEYVMLYIGFEWPAGNPFDDQRQDIIVYGSVFIFFSGQVMQVYTGYSFYRLFEGIFVVAYRYVADGLPGDAACLVKELKQCDRYRAVLVCWPEPG